VVTATPVPRTGAYCHNKALHVQIETDRQTNIRKQKQVTCLTRMGYRGAGTIRHIGGHADRQTGRQTNGRSDTGTERQID